MRYGTSVSHINVNRHNIDPKTHGWWEGPNYDGVSDKKVRVLAFESLDGNPIAIYYNYAVFNVITGVLDLVSGDITGEASRYIEASFDDTVIAALSLGAHGDQNPIYFQQTYDLRELRIKDYAKRGEDISNAMPPPGGVGLDRNDPAVARLMNQQKRMVLSLGQMLGEAVLHAMRGALGDVSTVGIYGKQATVTCPGRQRTNVGRSGVAGEYTDADPVQIRLGVLVVGNVAIAHVNAIPYAAIGLRLEKASPYARTMLTTRANGMSRAGYVPDDALVRAPDLLGAQHARQTRLCRDGHRRGVPGLAARHVSTLNAWRWGGEAEARTGRTCDGRPCRRAEWSACVAPRSVLSGSKSTH